ncbi:MAG: MBL fold metallo-hydrolase [Candidatus Binatia bacterium]|nr:MAG: MBL fold metallo-hydrolase [Candidatus Binatia bacterium]
MVRTAIIQVVLLVLVLLSSLPMARAGAPRCGDEFCNAAGPRPLPGLGEMFPFFLRKAWTSLNPRAGGARWIPYDRHALEHNPSITWIGHSTFLVRMEGVTFLTDPIFSWRASPVSFAGPQRLQPPGIPLEELPPVDFVTVSHDHYDHADLPTWKALARRGVLFVVPLGMGDLVHSVGGRFVALDWWQSVELPSVTVTCVPAQHFSGRGFIGHNRRLWAGWVVAGKHRKFYHAGDTGYFAGFKEIGARLGPIDLAALPIGAYDPPAIMRFVHLNPEEAVQAARDVGAKRVVAMHWGTFDLTDESLDEPPARFRAAAQKLGYGDDQAWVLAVGETRRW